MFIFTLNFFSLLPAYVMAHIFGGPKGVNAEIITKDWKRDEGDSDKGIGCDTGIANLKALVKMKKCRKVKDKDKTPGPCC